VPLLLAAIAIGLAYLTAVVLRAASFHLAWWVATPSVGAFYGLLFGVFDSRLWRIALVRKFVFVNTPDLSGHWVGAVESSYQGVTHPIEVEIRQKWTHIAIRLTSANSQSRSNIAGVECAELDHPILTYDYINEPRVGASETMHTHRGMARLEFRAMSSPPRLVGDYFSGRDRQNYGELNVGRT
jgi:hypothetical protein